MVEGLKTNLKTFLLPEKFLVIILFEMIRFTQLPDLGLQKGQPTFNINDKTMQKDHILKDCLPWFHFLYIKT